MIEIFFMRVFQSVLQKSFLQDVRHNLWEILPGWKRCSGLRQLNSGKIYRKVGRADWGMIFQTCSGAVSSYTVHHIQSDTCYQIHTATFCFSRNDIF